MNLKDVYGREFTVADSSGIVEAVWIGVEGHRGLLTKPMAKRTARALQKFTGDPSSEGDENAFLQGFALALAEMHRRLVGGNDSTGVCEVARNAGVTIAKLRKAKVADIDLRELRRAGVR